MARPDGGGVHRGVRDEPPDFGVRVREPVLTALGAAVGFGVAAAIGTLLRWRASTALGAGGTLLVNIAGAFALGLLASTSGATAAVVGTAGLGALTTVSGIFPEIARLMRASPALALGYVALTITGATAAATAGLALV